MIIAIDCGKHSTKITFEKNGELITKSFRTKMSEANELSEIGISNGIKKVTFDEDDLKGTYIVGEAGEGETDMSNSKNTPIHKVCALTAIAENVENGETVHVVIGAPLSEYANKEKRDRYRDFVVPKKKIEMWINGKKKWFTIDKRLVVAESSGILYVEPERFRSGSVGVIDIGGLNINCAAYLRGNLISETCFTSKLGSNVITRELRLALNQTFDLQLKPWQMDEIIENGAVTNMEEETCAFVSNYFNGQIDKIIKECTENGWDTRTMSLVFIGGTSRMLESQIKEKFPKAYIPNQAEYANVRGFYELLKNKLGYLIK